MFIRNIMISAILLLICGFSDTICREQEKVLLGVDVLVKEKSDLIKGKKVGLITNPTGMTSEHISTIDALHAHPNISLTALYGPEHGVRGDVEGGLHIESYSDAKSGLPVYSLYGRTRKPSPEMLENLDVLIYDIQDVGSRAYTYIYTMALAMEAAKEKAIPFFVLDRPNPLGGELLAGPVLDPAFKSSIGMYPIPYIYGLTVGELARLFNEEFNIDADLTVVPMRGWQRSQKFPQTGIMWVPTSPHIPHAESAFYYATVGCIGELHTVNEGVGTPTPFEVIGAPWIDAAELADELNSRALPGVYFRPLHYKPFYFVFKDADLQGVQIHILDRDVFRPMRTQIHILTAVRNLYTGRGIFDTDRVSSFDKAMGTDRVRKDIMAGRSAEDIINSWSADMEAFKEIRTKYLLY